MVKLIYLITVLDQLEEDVLKKQEEIEANLLEQSIYETSIEEILKEQSKLDVEIVKYIIYIQFYIVSKNIVRLDSVKPETATHQQTEII